jgi:hypothetical protein
VGPPAMEDASAGRAFGVLSNGNKKAHSWCYAL